MDPTRTTENSAEIEPSIVIVLCEYHVIPPYRPPFLESSAVPSSAVQSTAVPSSAAASGPRWDAAAEDGTVVDCTAEDGTNVIYLE